MADEGTRGPTADDPDTAWARPSEPLEHPRRRRRWPWVLGILVVLLVAAGFAADSLARGVVEDRIRAEVADQLGLASSDDVAVDLGAGSILWQAIRGRVDRLALSAPDASFGDYSGDLTLTAAGVPLDPAAPVESLRVDFAISESEADRLAASLSGVDLDSVAFSEPEIDVEATLSVLFVSLPVSMSLEPSASQGRLEFTPITVRAAGAEVSGDDLLNGPVGGIARDFLTQQAVCVDELMPSNLRLDTAEVVGDELVLHLDGSGRPFVAAGKGTCG